MNEPIENNKLRFRETIAYIVSLVIFLVSFWSLFFWQDRFEWKKPGEIQKPHLEATHSHTPKSGKQEFFTLLKGNFQHPIARILLQILIVVLFSRILANIFKKIGQPGVIGEITAGILLGPSLLGMLFPEITGFLFPKDSMKNLQVLSQFGLIIFMFIIGMELDLSTLKEKASSAVLISHTSIIFPFILGAGLAIYLFPKYASSGVSFLAFGLFMGIAMSITAFPVLARVVQEKGLSRSPLGTISLTCAAIDDLTAWSSLAIIVAVVQSSGFLSTLFTLGLIIAFIVFMVYIIQPFLNKLSRVYMTQEIIGRGVISLLVLLVLFSALVTETLGIHGLFGAFLAGVIMPNYGELRKVLAEKFEDFSAVLLLPLFFAFTGLRTEIGLLSKSELWIDCFLIVLVATLGKLGGSSLIARYVGLSWKESFTIGALMNTRGLMELIVLNIGYDLGILSPEIFTMMVLMALITTLTTGPLVDIFYKRKIEVPIVHESVLSPNVNRILIAFGLPRSGEVLFKLASSVFGESAHYSAIHLTPLNDRVIRDEPVHIKKKSFDSILKISKERKISINTIFQISDNITNELINCIYKEQSNFVLMGAANPIFGDSVVSGKVQSILQDVDCNVGIFVDKGFDAISSLIILYKNSNEADQLFRLGGLIQKSGVTDIHLVYEKGNEPPEEKLRANFTKSIRTITTDKQSKKVFNKFSLLLIGYDHWMDMGNTDGEKFINEKNDWQKENSTSILIIRKQLY